MQLHKELGGGIGVFWRYALRCFFGELGDRSFFVTLLLTAWVASWASRRAAKRVVQHQLMVLAGALLGLLLHLTWVTLHINGRWAASTFNFMGMALLVAIGIQIDLELRRLQKDAIPSLDKAESETGDGGDPTWNSYAQHHFTKRTSWNPWAGTSEAGDKAATTDQSSAIATSQSYGTIKTKEVPPTINEGEEEAPFWSYFIVGILTAALIFVLEVGEKAQYSFLTTGEEKGFMLIFGSMLGYLPATCIAVLSGYMLEIQLPPKWLPSLWFAAELAFFGMALACFSQAILGFGSLAIVVKKATVVLLGFKTSLF